MRPLEGEGPPKKPITDVPSRTNPFLPNLYFRGLGKMGQDDQSQRVNDSRTSGPPPGGYGNRGNFNYKKNEDRSTAETRDVNRGSSGLKKGMPMPNYVRREMPTFGKKEYLSQAIQRRLRTTRNT